MYRLASATTLPILNKSKLANLIVPIPPSQEQRHIINKITELFNLLK